MNLFFFFFFVSYKHNADECGDSEKWEFGGAVESLRHQRQWQRRIAHVIGKQHRQQPELQSARQQYQKPSSQPQVSTIHLLATPPPLFGFCIKIIIKKRKEKKT